MHQPIQIMLQLLFLLDDYLHHIAFESNLEILRNLCYTKEIFQIKYMPRKQDRIRYQKRREEKQTLS